MGENVQKGGSCVDEGQMKITKSALMFRLLAREVNKPELDSP
jgi:hypothetical protein